MSRRPDLVAAAPRLAAIGMLAGLVALRTQLPAQVVLVVMLGLLPGWLLLEALGVAESAARQPIWVPAASLTLLMTTGIVVDIGGHALSARGPLSTWPLVVVLCLELVGLVAVGARRGFAVRIPRPAVPARQAWPLLLPLVALLGARRLNLGEGSAVAVSAAALAVAFAVVALLAGRRISRAQCALLLFSAGLAIVWSFSARGDLVYGFDVASEYSFAHSTDTSHYWAPSQSQNAYSAMASISLLPTTLRQLTGMPLAAVFQYVFPLFFAGLVVGVFYLAHHFVRRRAAVIASLLIVSQYTFFSQLPQLARQEIALILFAALIAAVVDDILTSKRRAALIVLFSAAMVVSHYTTTYVAFGMLAVLTLLELCVRRRGGGRRVSPLALIALATTGVTAAVWYGPVTHSTSNLVSFASSIHLGGLDLFQLPSGENSVTAILTGNQPSALSPQGYQAFLARGYLANRTYVHPLAVANDAQWRLLPTPAPPGSASGIDYIALPGDRIALLLVVVGALAAALRRRVPAGLRRIGLLGLPVLIAFLLFRLSGSLAQHYGPLRLLLQAEVVAAVSAVALLETLHTNWRRVGTAIMLGVGLLQCAVLADGLGLVRGDTHLTTTNLANQGEDQARFVMTAQEVAAADWLGRAAPRGALVYADRYAHLRYVAQTGRADGLLLDVTPQTIDAHAWIYADRANIVLGQARANAAGRAVLYEFPKAYLDRYYNVVFNNGQAEVFHR